MLTYQVEYMSRPDERDHAISFESYSAACNLARRMSDKHDGSAYVIAYEETGHGALARIEAVGAVTYVFGNRDSVDGRVK